MSGTLGSALAAATLICIFSLMLKNFGYKGTPALVCVGILFMLSTSSGGVLELIPQLRSFGGGALQEGYVSSAIKLVGVGYVSGICADMCSELGEGMVGKYVTVAGRLEMIAIAAPYVGEILKTVGEYV